MTAALHCPSGLRIKSAMTVWERGWRLSESGLDSRLRGNDGMGYRNDGPGEVGVGLLYAPPCGYCLEASMTGPCPSGLRIKSAMT